MVTQLMTTGKEVTICLGCGLPRLEVEGFYPLQNNRCGRCRIEDGEDMAECMACEEEVFKDEMYEESLFMSPWDDEEKETGFIYCQGCMDSGNNDPDGQTFYCDGCNRQIASDNGRMKYYRILDECEQVCLKCIEDELKQGGVAAIDDGDDMLAQVFAGQRIFGMFFNVGELEDEGWTPDPDYHNVLIDESRSKTLGSRCQQHHDAKRIFIIGYESLSIVGGEGYVTLYTKEVT